MAAEFVGADYTIKPVNPLKGETKTPEFLAVNPMHNIPALRDGDLCLNEGRAIAAYLINKVFC